MMPPMNVPAAPAPMPPAPDAAGMPCPHCKMPIQLQKHAPAGPVPMAPKHAAPTGKKDEKPAKKKNAASMPMDELKEVIKGGKSDGNE